MTRDEELMTALYTEHYGVLLGFVSRYERDRHRAEDLVQETLLRAWKHIGRIDVGRDTTRSYLLTIARNVVSNAWRAEQRRPRLVADPDAVEAVAAADNVDEMVEGWLIKAALDRLSAEHREVVQSVYYDGRTVADTARKLSVPEGTVKSRAFYAVRALRAVFEEMGVLR
ncbi:sigma-70 family RNA polymerase sigma factor [Dactylosporangium sp. AC04546]|uniref:sigma-70 family RNA polymerase sigma factor n=1 Tax=unclassified Dactylosporangium TaxID=2621675 RepID=UPI001EDDCAC7|nr:sigma-70 family RNA polymerase sigma factor [Dactylosporangium sp. AC04546]WVK81969.1 sigma-70 family RNA polymerase sigma factor [Dactylosporangium sp. AC04546]